MDLISLGLAKQYVNETANSLGAVKGAPATIESITPVDGGNNVVFGWTGSNGQKRTQTMFVKDGKDGKDGSGGSAEGAVLYTKQELTPEQKAQARENVGAASAAEVGTVKDNFPVYPSFTEDPNEDGQTYSCIDIVNADGQNIHLLGKTLCVKTYAYGDMTWFMQTCDHEWQYNIYGEEILVNPNADITNNPESGVCEFEITIPEEWNDYWEALSIYIPFAENPYTELEIYEKKGTVWSEIAKNDKKGIIASGVFEKDALYCYWRKWGDGFAECWVEFYGLEIDYMEDTVVQLYIPLPISFSAYINVKVLATARASDSDGAYTEPILLQDAYAAMPSELDSYWRIQTAELVTASGTAYVAGYWNYPEGVM